MTSGGGEKGTRRGGTVAQNDLCKVIRDPTQKAVNEEHCKIV